MSAILVFAALFASVAFVKSDIPFVDGCETIATNPARGHAGGGWVTFKPEGLPNWHGQGGYHSSLWELSRFSGGREQDGKRPIPERVGGKDLPITDAMKADVRRFLTETREKGGSLIVRLGYTWSEQQGCEPENFDLLLEHVRELSRILAEFDDVVVGVEAGVAGPWGEMHSSDYCREEYMRRILKTYVDNLGPRIPILVRAPKYLEYVDNPARFGMYNDGYLGTWWDYGTWAGAYTRERGCFEILQKKNDLPYGGEMAYIGRDWLEKNRDLFDLKKWNIVQEWYATHLNYLRNITEGGHTLADFLKNDLTFENEKYTFADICDLHEYNGRTMSKFVMDHMGYRFVIRDARIPKAVKTSEAFAVALDIENTGFGRVLLPMKAELILRPVEKREDSSDIVIPVKCPFDLKGGTRARMALKGGAPAKLSKGPVDLFLRVYCPTKGEVGGAVPRRTIRFANRDIWDEGLKANRIGRTNCES